MSTNYKIPRGTYDILPAESYKWNYLRKTFEETAELFGYQQISTPIFEKAGLFERSVGDSTDIVQKEMYKFQDRRGREFALRPEGTAPVVRSFVENNLLHQENGNRLYYFGPMFRYDRPQKGRYRQFYQYGVENFGSEHPYTDAEVIALGYTFLKKFGLSDFTLEINSIGSPACSDAHNKALIEYFTPFKDKLCGDCQKRMDQNPKRIIDCKNPNCKEIAKDAPSMLDYLDEECSNHFAGVQKYLKIMDIPFEVNPKIVRGLDYYSKTAFEYINNNLGAQNALGGGGRYDGLVEQIGGKPTPGIGFAGGCERLLLSIENEKLYCGEKPHPKVFFVTMGDKAEAQAVKLISSLRKAGIQAGYEIDKNSLGAQMKAAGKAKADYTVIIGDEEVDSGKLALKDMQTGEQKNIAFSELLEYNF